MYRGGRCKVEENCLGLFGSPSRGNESSEHGTSLGGIFST